MRRPPAGYSHVRRVDRGRLWALIRKETIQIGRDPSSILIAFVAPIVLLFLFGYGVSLDATHVPIGVVIETPSPAANSFRQSLAASPYFKPRVFADRASAVAALDRGAIGGFVLMREDFGRRLDAEDGSSIQVVLNGTDANSAQLLSGYLQGAWQVWTQQMGYAEGKSRAPVVHIESRVWYNPEVHSQFFLVPGLIAIIMTLIGALLTALVVAREWERGTMEALLVTPVTVAELLLGKLIPYFVLGMSGMAVSVAMAVGIFGVPFRGSFWLLTLVSAAFLMTALGLGLLISVTIRNQFVAAQTAITASYLPAFMLSGFLFDIASMPKAIQYVTYLVPARYFVSILQTIFMVGDVWRVILPNLLALIGAASLFLALSVRRTRKRLD